MSWSEGRRLSSLTTGGNTTTYTYDLNGLRNKKVNADGTWVEYFIADGKTIGETLHRANNTEVYDMRYTFDENGDVCGISIWRSNVTGWEKYYFVKNLQGDVLAIYKSGDTFTKVGEYTYDSWGNVLSVTGVPSNDDAATLNPFRYRSYYQDPETNFYYLQSRYYDPAIGRFINSDEFTSTGQDFAGYNMFAYCGNNPVSRKDDEGNFWNFVIGGAVGALVGGISAAVSSYTDTGSVNWGTVAIGTATGLVGGLVGASGLCAGGQAIVSGVLGAVNNIGSSFSEGKEIDLMDVAVDAGIGFASSLVGYAATKKLSDSAERTINNGIKRIITGKDSYDSGSRYWKGAIKRGVRAVREGVYQLNVARGKASVIGSSVCGAIATAKSVAKHVWRRLK